jgi:aminoglycoside 3-N-acetyltransferase
MDSQSITLSSLRIAFEQLGLRAGMGLVMHSSLSTFGYVEDGASTVIRALQEALTPSGTLLMPSFNHNTAFDPGAPGYYDPTETPTTNGIIPDTFWRMPGVHRSLDPTHAVAAWGSHALDYTQNHHRTLTMGPASPLGMLQHDGGYCLLLGVSYHANTFHHVVEMTTSAPCLGKRTEAYPVRLPGGRTVLGRTWGWRDGTCPITDTGRYIPLMHPIQQQVKVGNAMLTLYKLQDGYGVIAPLLQNGVDGFPPCSDCPIRPRLTPFTVPSDWDSIKQQPVPESTGWTY